MTAYQRPQPSHRKAGDTRLIVIGGKGYELMLDHKDGWNPEAFRGRYSEVLDRYDYIIGDWGYSQLRLKGFYRDNHPKVNRDTAISGMVDYINEYCNFGCAYFVLHKLKEAPQEGTFKDILIKEVPEPGTEEELEQEAAESAGNVKDHRESPSKGGTGTRITQAVRAGSMLPKTDLCVSTRAGITATRSKARRTIKSSRAEASRAIRVAIKATHIIKSRTKRTERTIPTDRTTRTSRITQATRTSKITQATKTIKINRIARTARTRITAKVSNACSRGGYSPGFLQFFGAFSRSVA